MQSGLPLKTQIGIFHNEEEIASWLYYQNDSSIYAFDYIKLIKYAPFIYTDFTQEVLLRYSLFKNHNVYSFSNKFEELPAWWIDTINLLDSEYIKAEKAWQRQQQPT